MFTFELIPFAVLILIIGFLIGLLRTFIGPANEDRMMSVQLVGTTSIAMLVLLSQVMDIPAAIDVALILALLAAVAVIALTKKPLKQENRHD